MSTTIEPHLESYATIMQGQSRIAGVLLHPTSLPSGMLDGDVFKWLDFLSQAGLRLWQVLPLGVPQGNLSPYQCYSAFAINPALLVSDTGCTEFISEEDKDEEFEQWLQRESYWLDDYALFMVLKRKYVQSAWFEWPDPYKIRDAGALEAFRLSCGEELNAIFQQQYRLYSRWREIRHYACERGIYLFGDMPLFVAHDSADVWANQSYFLLDDQGTPEVVAGVPPDYFSETGQRWGNPHFDWEEMQKNQFDWWMSRLKNHLQLFDLVRIDHFRGFESVWVIEAKNETAEKGIWKKVPGEKLLEKLKDEMGDITLVAEDLGIITPQVNLLRERFQLPGMSVLQFAFDGFDDNPHKPKNITHDRIVYSGTHDNDTTRGWFENLSEDTQTYVQKVLGLDENHAVEAPIQVTESLIDKALETQAQLAVFPMQDFLHLGSEARMNIPGTIDNNWLWHFQWDQIPENLATQIRQKLQRAGRV